MNLLILHVYNTEQLPEFIKYIKLLPKIHIAISICPEKLLDYMDYEDEIKSLTNNYKLFIVPNLGRDVAPFLYIISKIPLDDYRFILKLHTKKEPLWRYKMIIPLLQTECLNLLQSSTGIVGEDRYYFCDRIMWMRENEEDFNRLISDFNLPDEFGFIGGNCYWINSKICKYINSVNKYSSDNFVAHNKIDGELEHAFERIQLALCNKTKLNMLLTKMKLNDIKKFIETYDI